ncbi:MAG: cyclic nucleotide-binding domain-containing protein [Rhodospirillales bacterium]|nr:cyclic nucleotide-binding domain-containing protein [Rhodospirillales bacterium]
MRYYATPLVRAAVTKKLCTLLSIDEQRFGSYFDIIDLPSDKWTDIDGLEVKPVFSPHPVETSILFFRSLWEDGYRTYAHCADITSSRVLSDMTTEKDDVPGISPEKRDQVLADYRVPANLKKIDIGGGLIHGEAEDFRDDWSGRILLGHVARPLSAEEKEIGSAAHFGTIDKIIPSSRDYARRDAFSFMQSYFPNLARHSLQILLNNEVETFNPETSLVREGDYLSDIFLILTGSIEMVAKAERTYLLSAGAMIGELAALKSMPANVTYRAIGYVRALRIPVPLYREFVRRHDLMNSINALGEIREFFKTTWLLGEEISCPTNHRIANSATLLEVGRGDLKLEESDDYSFSLFIVREGEIERQSGEDHLEKLGPGDFFGGSAAFFGEPDPAHFRATVPSTLYKISVAAVSDIPAVRWKLFETHQNRQKALGY